MELSHGEKSKIRWASTKAIRDGLLQKQPCEKCGSPVVIAHHADYSKPLDVTWLCRSCHLKVHASLKTKEERKHFSPSSYRAMLVRKKADETQAEPEQVE